MISIVEIENIRGYVDGNGTTHINLEDAARGLGFVDFRWCAADKKKTARVRWSRVREYCTELGYPLVAAREQNVFIPENIFYKLCMKSSNETAEKFQNLVCDEILPQIRKTGGYIPIDDEDIMAKALVIAQRTIASRKQRISQPVKGEIVTQTAKITEKGQIYFLDLLKEENNVY